MLFESSGGQVERIAHLPELRFALGSGRGADGRFERVSFREAVLPEDVMFESDIYLLTRDLAERLKAPAAPEPETPTAGEVARAVRGRRPVALRGPRRARTCRSIRRDLEPAGNEAPAEAPFGPGSEGGRHV